MGGHNERSLSVEEALSLVDSAFAEARLTPELHAHGAEPFQVHRCLVRDSDGEVLTTSLGKGLMAQSRASALFEAWEHLLHEQGSAAVSAVPKDVKVIPSYEIIAQPELVEETMLARLADEFPDARVGCLRFTEAKTGKSIWYPSFPKNPFCRRHPILGDTNNYQQYLRYASTSGTAIGITEDDARLHALLEAIERDAVSLALLDWYFKKPPKVRMVDATCFLGGLRTLYECVLDTLGFSVVVLDITTDIGVPVYVAIPSSGARALPGRMGIGASLHPAYAIERALTELLQLCLAVDPDARAGHVYRIRELQKWPLLARCATLDAELLLPHATVVHPETAWWDRQWGNVATQLDEIVNGLSKYGYRAYWWSWAQHPFPVVTALVPGFEMFFNVTLGVPVLPSGRGTERLLSSQGV